MPQRFGMCRSHWDAPWLIVVPVLVFLAAVINLPTLWLILLTHEDTIDSQLLISFSTSPALSRCQGLSLRESVAQFSHTMTAQTDLRVEAAHLARFGANFHAMRRQVSGIVLGGDRRMTLYCAATGKRQGVIRAWTGAALHCQSSAHTRLRCRRQQPAASRPRRYAVCTNHSLFALPMCFETSRWPSPVSSPAWHRRASLPKALRWAPAANKWRQYPTAQTVFFSLQVAIPRVFAGLAAPGVLVESFEAGASVAAFMGRRAAINTQIVQRGLDTYLKMLLLDNFVHTDLHPGAGPACCCLSCRLVKWLIYIYTMLRVDSFLHSDLHPGAAALLPRSMSSMRDAGIL